MSQDVRQTGHKFDYKTVKISKVEVELINFNEASPEQQRTAQGGNYLYNGGKLITAVIIDGERIVPSSRFWDSLYARFNLGTSFFKYFDHKEVFARITERASDDKIRVCIERKPTGDKRLLAATGPKRPVLVYDDLIDLLERFKVQSGITYSNGIITSTHSPRIVGSDFNVGGDMFRNSYVMAAPIDGYGEPNIYLSMLRLICSNGMVGLANSFKTSLKLGSSEGNTLYSLQRALEGFQNEEGYAALRERFETATMSWASVKEQQELYRLLMTIQRDPSLSNKADLMKRYEDMTGRPHEIYHADPNTFTEKRIRTLPVACKVYDMLNFATEVATHKVSTEGNRRLQAWVGGMLSGEYDLEGSCDQFGDFKELWLSSNRAKLEDARKAVKGE